MAGAGTLLNVATVLAGGSAGLWLGARFAPRLRQAAFWGIGIVTGVMGMQMALQTQNILILLTSLLAGGLLGSGIRLQERVDAFGQWVERLFFRQARAVAGEGRFAEGFVAASLLFCVGPMTVLGALQDGLQGDIHLLAVKSALDGISALIFASSMGAGVLLSTLSVLVIQGSITALAGLLHTFINNAMITALSAAGGAMVIMISLSLLEIKTLRVADFLPALLFAPLFAWVAALL